MHKCLLVEMFNGPVKLRRAHQNSREASIVPKLEVTNLIGLRHDYKLSSKNRFVKSE